MPAKEVSSWLVNGLIAVHQKQAPALAFAHAGGSFGQTSREWRATDELKALFELLDQAAKRRFHEAIAQSIEDIEAVKDNLDVLRDLTEIGLLTRCNLAVVLLAAKIRSPDPEVRAVVYDLSGFYLAERDAPEAVKALALQILRNGDYPETLSLQLLVATARYASDALVEHAVVLMPGLQHLLLSKDDWPRGYRRFHSDFADAVLRGPEVDTVLPRLLRHPAYVSLLLPYMESVGPGMVQAKLEPPLLTVIRVSASELTGKARAHLFPEAKRSVRESRALVEA